MFNIFEEKRSLIFLFVSISIHYLQYTNDFKFQINYLKVRLIICTSCPYPLAINYVLCVKQGFGSALLQKQLTLEIYFFNRILSLNEEKISLIKQRYLSYQAVQRR